MFARLYVASVCFPVNWQTSQVEVEAFRPSSIGPDGHTGAWRAWTDGVPPRRAFHAGTSTSYTSCVDGAKVHAPPSMSHQF